jgi:metal-responsive CopG/Arc/MetJ family transcriptional regulator
MAKVNISISQEILEEIDALSKEENMSRSELIRKAFQTYVEVLTEKKKERKKRKGIEKAVELQDEIRNKIGYMDLVEDLRNWRSKRK